MVAGFPDRLETGEIEVCYEPVAADRWEDQQGEAQSSRSGLFLPVRSASISSFTFARQAALWASSCPLTYKLPLGVTYTLTSTSSLSPVSCFRRRTSKTGNHAARPFHAPGEAAFGRLPRSQVHGPTMSNTFGVWDRRCGYGGPALSHGPCSCGNSSRRLPA